MAQLTTFSVPGIKLWFNSNDHEPPHFHAKRRGQWEFRIMFLEAGEAMFQLKWRRSEKTTISAQDKRILMELVEKHRFELLQEWEHKVITQ